MVLFLFGLYGKCKKKKKCFVINKKRTLFTNKLLLLISSIMPMKMLSCI